MKAKHQFINDSEETKDNYIRDLKDFEIEMKKIGIDIFLFYGTLLGAVRENNFIAHDNDIDIAFCAKKQGKQSAIKERKQLEDYLKKNKWLRNNKTNGIKITYRNSNFDMWTGYIENNTFFIFSHKLLKLKIFPLTKLSFRFQEFNVPNNSEYVLDTIYLNWKTPILKTERYLK